MSGLPFYTVIGYYEDTYQRFAETFQATDPTDAENQARAKYGILVCGVVYGDVDRVDTEEYVT